MGITKDYLLAMDDERCAEWIRERIDYDDDCDYFVPEESEQWEQLREEYYQLQEYLYEQAEARAELHWLESRKQTEEFKKFKSEISKLEVILHDAERFGCSSTICKMVYVHSVTLLESFLSDTLKSLIVKEPQYFKNAIKNINEIKNEKFSLVEIDSLNGCTTSLLLKKLSGIMYHNIPKMQVIYSKVLDKRLNIDISRVVEIVNIRHDIVHRNGTNTEGETVEVSQYMAHEAIGYIEKLVENFYKEIHVDNS